MYRYGRGVTADYKEMVKWYENLTEKGNDIESIERANTLCNLGFINLKGQGVPQNYKKAVKYFKEAAEKGHLVAQFNLGILYEKGFGVIQDYKEAAKWYKKSLQQGNEDAKRRLRKLQKNNRK